MSAARREAAAFLLVAIALFAWGAWEASGFPGRARVFPQFSSLAGLAAGLAALVRALRGGEERPGGPAPSGPEEPDAPADRAPSFTAQVRAALPYLLWLGGLYVGIYLLGFAAASGLFLLFFLRYPGELSWGRAAVGAAGAEAVLLLLAHVVNLSLPGGLLIAL